MKTQQNTTDKKIWVAPEFTSLIVEATEGKFLASVPENSFFVS